MEQYVQRHRNIAKKFQTKGELLGVVTLEEAQGIMLLEDLNWCAKTCGLWLMRIITLRKRK